MIYLGVAGLCIAFPVLAQVIVVTELVVMAVITS
jgi:hypothetical protein